MAFVELLPLSECRVGAGTLVHHGEHELAVFRLVDPRRLFVIDNVCPHGGASLAGGDVDGDEVTCRWHFWRFDLKTGCCQEPNRPGVRVFPSGVRDGVVWADLPDS